MRYRRAFAIVWAFITTDRGAAWAAFWIVSRRPLHAMEQRRYRRTAPERDRASQRRYRNSWRGRLTRAHWNRTPPGVRYYVNNMLNWLNRSDPLYADRWREWGDDCVPPGLVLGDGTGAMQPARTLAAKLIADAIHTLEQPGARFEGTGRQREREQTRAWVQGGKAPVTFDLCCGVLGFPVDKTRDAVLAFEPPRDPGVVTAERIREVLSPSPPNFWDVLARAPVVPPVVPPRRPSPVLPRNYPLHQPASTWPFVPSVGVFVGHAGWCGCDACTAGR